MFHVENAFANKLFCSSCDGSNSNNCPKRDVICGAMLGLILASTAASPATAQNINDGSSGNTGGGSVIANTGTLGLGVPAALGTTLILLPSATSSCGAVVLCTYSYGSSGVGTTASGTPIINMATTVFDPLALKTSYQNTLITGIAPGTVSATSNDAVNGSQLYGVATATNNLGASVATLIGGGTVIGSDGSIVTPPTISVGGATYTNVTAAIQAGDAKANTANAGFAAALGGGTSVAANGTVTAPSYSIGGSTYTNVGAALTALDTEVTSLSGSGSSLVQQTGGTPGNGQITVGAATGGTSISVSGTSGNRVITGVANGNVAAGSSDAVNGGQLYAVQQTANGALQTSGGTMTGAINMGGNAITNLADPVNATDAANKEYVDSVAASAAATSTNLGQSVATRLGGGSTYNAATGTVTAPSYSVGGQSYNNVGSALAATNALAVQYVADGSGNPTNAVKLTGDGSGAAVSLTNVAAGNVALGSTDAVNGGQLYAVQQNEAGAVQYDRNPDNSINKSSVTLGVPGTPVTISNVAAGVQATDAVNVGQLQAAQTSTLTAANAYTDSRINGLNFDLNSVAKKAYAGSAAAIALQAPALYQPGSFAMRFGSGVYRGQYAMGVSFRSTSDNGRWSLSGGISGGPNAGVAASAGVDILLSQ